ncbi:SRPBCC domain-containing protein [Pleomorphovibrio marinus]|uniref:SRPBCC domain-containing protein n=1 Tax=Pleomorphovibrio marinus TaxID=2164132 RepID=UPI000E0A57BF|nr:SRPBCC domain-containing protein [Pleomorphovibrio marinus]
MKEIAKRLRIRIPTKIAFRKFVNELNEWWPKEYTWSQEKLKEIKIDGRKGGLCTEIGPNGFRCDWGTVIEFAENELIGLKWQISPKREPVPNPDKGSSIMVNFKQEDSITEIEFRHFDFKNHGEGTDDYRKMMDSEHGWEYILNCFKIYCEKRTND